MFSDSLGEDGHRLRPSTPHSLSVILALAGYRIMADVELDPPTCFAPASDVAPHFFSSATCLSHLGSQRRNTAVRVFMIPVLLRSARNLLSTQLVIFFLSTFL